MSGCLKRIFCQSGSIVYQKCVYAWILQPQNSGFRAVIVESYGLLKWKEGEPPRRSTFPEGSPSQKDHLTRRVTFPEGSPSQKGHLPRRVTFPEGSLSQKGHLPRRVTFPEGSPSQKGHLPRRVTFPEGSPSQKGQKIAPFYM